MRVSNRQSKVKVEKNGLSYEYTRCYQCNQCCDNKLDKSRECYHFNVRGLPRQQMMMGVEIEDREPGGLVLTHPHRIASALLLLLFAFLRHNNIGFELAIYPTKPETVEGLPSASPKV